MVAVAQGEVWWADLDDPVGSGPGYRRPVVIVQSDLLNATRLATVLVVPLTANLRWADAPGNVRLTAKQTGLPRDSAANVTQLTSIDRSTLQQRTGKLRRPKLDLLLEGIAFALGR